MANNQYLHNVAAQGIGRILTSAVSFLIFVFIARVLGAEVFGQYAYILAFLAIIGMAADFGTQSVLAKDIAQENNPQEYWGNYLIIRIVLAVFVIAIGLTAALFLRQDLYAYILLGCLLLPFLSFRCFEPIYQVFEKPWYSAHISLVYALSHLVLAGTAILFFPGLWPVLIAFFAANIIYTFVAFYLSQRVLKPVFKFNPLMIKKCLRLAVPIGCASFFSLINSKADIFMLAAMKTDYALGIYSTAYKFLDLTLMMVIVFMSPVIPIFARMAIQDREGLRLHFAQLMEFLLIITVPCALMTPLLSPGLIKLMFGLNFIPSAEVLNILAWGGVLIFYSLFSVAICLAIGVVHFGWWNAGLAAIINITLNYFWIPKYSYIGCSYATLISEIWLLVITFIYIRKHLGQVFYLKHLAVIIVIQALFAGLLQSHRLIPIWLTLPISVVIYISLVLKLRLIREEFLQTFIINKYHAILARMKRA